MTDRVVRKLHFTPKLLLRVAGWLTIAAVALFVLVAAAQSPAQSPTDMSVAKGGPKLTKSEGDPTGLPGLDATKAPTDVMVIDHAEKPSEN